jgi:hypothetical protein
MMSNATVRLQSGCNAFAASSSAAAAAAAAAATALLKAGSE